MCPCCDKVLNVEASMKLQGEQPRSRTTLRSKSREDRANLEKIDRLKARAKESREKNKDRSRSTHRGPSSRHRSPISVRGRSSGHRSRSDDRRRSPQLTPRFTDKQIKPCYTVNEDEAKSFCCAECDSGHGTEFGVWCHIRDNQDGHCLRKCSEGVQDLIKKWNKSGKWDEKMAVRLGY